MKEWVMNRQRKRGNYVGEREELKTKQNLLFCRSECRACRGKESAVRQSPACTSQPTVSIPPVALISQHTQIVSMAVLWHWLEQWWLSAGLGAVQSGCMCNLDVHRKAKFSIMMWSHAIETLVYSLLCLYFGQRIVYMIKCVEDFLGGILLNSVSESF